MSQVTRWACLSVAIIAEVGATLALKAAINCPGWYVPVVLGYIAAFGLLTICLRLGMAISVAYGAWGAGGVTTTAVVPAVLFNETLTWLMCFGILLMIAGIVLVEAGSQKAHRPKKARHPR
ncbi:DMT family transporter [Paenarthrobacter nitroguajacolicus]|uniref:DMT family transporter n=1 Tax=Paenarthrobacter nitroguajacolicus TaxID=211146 RepID=UPI00344392E1